MTRNMIRNILTALIVAGFFTGLSCAKKEISSQGTTVETTGQHTALDEDQATKDREAAEQQAIAIQELEDRMAREKEKERLALAKDRFVDRHILFAFDSSQLDEEAKAIVREKAAWLRDNPMVSVIIEGHCDQRGTTTYNLALGERRALSVKNYLENLGLPENRVAWVSFGEEKPLNNGQSDDAHQKNRRAQFRIQNPGDYIQARKN